MMKAQDIRIRPDYAPWLACYDPNPDAQVRLFCLPYTGGAAHIFRDWGDGLRQVVEVCPVQLPGRAERIKEKAFSDMRSLVEATANALVPHLDKPFALFGHSMGAFISFEIAHYLRKEFGLAPAYLFVSGADAPHRFRSNLSTHTLPRRSFIERLSRRQGAPRELLKNSELMDLMLPTLRADFAVCETYAYTNARPFDFPILAFGGLQDSSVSASSLRGWGKYTRGAFAVCMLPGDHFFLHTARPLLLRAIRGEISNLAGSIPRG